MSKTSPKTRGTNFERRIKKWLEKHGWAVFRSAGSRSPADLVAIKADRQILAVQCKASGSPQLKEEEVEGLIALSKMGARPLIISRNNKNYAIQVHELGFEDHGYWLQATFDWP